MGRHRPRALEGHGELRARAPAHPLAVGAVEDAKNRPAVRGAARLDDVRAAHGPWHGRRAQLLGHLCLDYRQKFIRVYFFPLCTGMPFPFTKREFLYRFIPGALLKLAKKPNV